MRFGQLDVRWLASWPQVGGDNGSLVGGRRYHTVAYFLTVRIHAAADLSCSTCGKHCHFGIIERDFPIPGGSKFEKNRATPSQGWPIFFFIFGYPYHTLGL